MGQRIKKLRVCNNLSIKDLASKCDLSPETISNIEHERTNPNISTIKKLATALNTDLAYLLQINDWPEDNLGQIIKKYRLLKGLTQEQLACLCGLHKSTIKDYEDNRIKGNTKTLDLILKTIDYI